MLPNVTPSELNHRLGRLLLSFLVAFLVVAAALAYWGVLRSEALLARGDNPRPIEAVLRERRGRILDISERVVADTQGTPQRYERVYPLATSGPAVGYYSVRYGTAGIERSFDSYLRGTTGSGWEQYRRRLLHIPSSGRDIRLTLDAALQDRIVTSMVGQRGAVVVIELPDAAAPAQIRALASSPGYNPNQLDEQFETLTADPAAPLLDRATQGLYQPGMLVQPFVLAAAIDQGLISSTESVAAINAPMTVGVRVFRCGVPPEETETKWNWLDVLARSCPAPMQSVGRALGNTGLDAVFRDFGLSTPVELPIQTATEPPAATADPALAAVGQDNLTTTPLQMAHAYATLVNNGRLPLVQLVDALQDSAGAWVGYAMPTSDAEPAADAATISAVMSSLPESNGWLETTASAIAGPLGDRDVWYVGLAPAARPRYVVVVVLENPETPSSATEIGREALSSLATN